MKQILNYLSLLLVVSIASIGAGCSKQARANRLLARANTDFQAEHYEQAEIEYLAALRLAPLNPLAIGRLGTIYYEEGRLLQALAFLDRAVESEPANVDLRIKLCSVLFASGKVKEAAEQAERILATQPGQEDALVVLADSGQTTNRIQDIRQQIEKMRQQDQDRSSYHLALGSLLLREGANTNAEVEIRKAIDMDPKSATAQTALGSLLLSRTELQQAEQALRAGAELSPVRSFRRLKYADLKFSAGEGAEARKILEEITQKAPDYLPAWNFLARLAFAEHKYDECAAFLGKVLAKDRINFDAVSLDAILKLVTGRNAEAVAETERLQSLYAGVPEVQYQLALAYLAIGNPARAVASLNRALALNPGSPDAILLLAEINIQKGNPASAIPSLTQLIRQQPQIVQAHALLGSAYLAQNDLDDAQSVYRRMVLLFPRNHQAPYWLANLLSQQSLLQERQNRRQDAQNGRQEARKYCEQSLAISPDFLPPLETMVDLDLADGQPQPALARVNKEIARRPSVAELTLLLAKIYHHENDLKGAEDALLKAVSQAPDLRTSHQLLAQLYLDQNKPELALEKLTSFVARTNDVQVLMQIGLLQEKLRNYPAARDAYEKLLATDPKFGPALNNLAYLYAEHLKEREKAAVIAEKARQMLPNDAGTADTLGWILFGKSEFPKALSLLEEAAAKLPAEPEVQLHVGMARYALGMEEPARLALEAALAATNDFPGKLQARPRLAILAIDSKSADPAARAALEKRLAEDPNDPVALARLAGIFQHEGAVEKAARAYEQILKQNPKNISALVSLSRLYSGPLKDSQKAIELAKAAHAAAPDDAVIAQMLGHFVLQIPDYKWAASLLQAAARKRQDQPALFYDLAWSLYGLGRLPEAEAAMQNALKLGPSFERSADARQFLTMTAAYRDPTQRQGAAAQLEQTLKADPNYLPGLMLAGVIRQDKGNYDEARQAFEQVLARDPLFVPATRALAILCFGHFPEDPKLYDMALKAREAFPADPTVAKILGIQAFRRGENPRASQLLKETTQKLNDDAEAFHYLGMSYYRLKQPAESKQALQKALTLNLPPLLAAQAKVTLADMNKPASASP